jgi:hypothetical protein
LPKRDADLKRAQAAIERMQEQKVVQHEEGRKIWQTGTGLSSNEIKSDDLLDTQEPGFFEAEGTWRTCSGTPEKLASSRRPPRSPEGIVENEKDKTITQRTQRRITSGEDNPAPSIRR